MDVGRLSPHWLDDVIEGVLRESNANAIARAVSHSERFLAAVQEGIKRANAGVRPGVMGPSHAQYIRQAIVEAIQSA